MPSDPEQTEDEGLRPEDQRVFSVLRRWEAAIRLLYPDEMTPTAKRIMESIIDDERAS